MFRPSKCVLSLNKPANIWSDETKVQKSMFVKKLLMVLNHGILWFPTDLVASTWTWLRPLRVATSCFPSVYQHVKP